MNPVDLLYALGNAEEKDIEASAGELPGKTSPWKTRLRWSAVAAAACLCVIAVPLLLRSGDRPIGVTVAAPAEEHERKENTVTYQDDDQFVFTLQRLYLASVPNLLRSLPQEIPLLTDRDWEIPEERQPLYFVTSQCTDEMSGTYDRIREAVKLYLRAHREDPQMHYMIYAPVCSLRPDGSPVVREWLFPVTDMGRLRGIYTVTQPEGTDLMQVVYTERDDASEDWIARLEGLAQYSSEEDPVCFLRDDGIGLIGLVNGKAYLIRPAKGGPFPPASIAPAPYVPDSETLDVERLDLSGTGIPVRYVAELTPEQIERYKDILYSPEEDPYLLRYDTEGMSEEEELEYFHQLSAAQGPATTAAEYLHRNVLIRYDGNGMSVWRDEYAGAYIWQNKLCVPIPVHVEGAEEFLKSLFDGHFQDRVIFREVEYSMNELEDFRNHEFIPALDENGIRWMLVGISDSGNCITAAVREKDLIRCCELILEKGWTGKVKLHRMTGEIVFTSAEE